MSDMTNLPDREEVRKALEKGHDRRARPLEDIDGLLLILLTAQAFVDGRLIDRQTLDYHAAEMAYFHRDEHAIPWESKARMVVDAAVGEGEQ